MPAFDNIPTPGQRASSREGTAQFPPVIRDHILNCSYDSWFTKYRSSCIKSRIIKLPPEFVDYLREDGITLADDDGGELDDDDWQPSAAATGWAAGPAQEPASDSDTEDDEGSLRPAKLPPNKRFPGLHSQIEEEIRQLGGKVVPKLNWSSPKDATWIMMDKNTMACTSANDVYLLLKSSSFISHDLEHAFEGCIPTGLAGAASPSPPAGPAAGLEFNPVLVLRPYFTPQTALEFRCFVKQRNLVAISQRDLKHYAFLNGLRPAIIARAKDLFDRVLRLTFPDGSFTFDIYIPEGDGGSETDDTLSRARLIDINPWAAKTDSLLFDWEELLDLHVPSPLLGTAPEMDVIAIGPENETDVSESTDEEDDSHVDDFEPELRLVEVDDPAASNFVSSQYSAHKLPREVVDASMAGGAGLREFAEQWKQLVERRGN